MTTALQDAQPGNDAPGHKETKAEAFKRLGQKRTLAALEKIDLLFHLTNPNSYEFTAEQAAKIVEALEGKVRKLDEKFGDALNGTREKEFEL